MVEKNKKTGFKKLVFPLTVLFIVFVILVIAVYNTQEEEVLQSLNSTVEKKDNVSLEDLINVTTPSSSVTSKVITEEVSEIIINEEIGLNLSTVNDTITVE